MGAPRRLSLSDLGRPALVDQVRIEVPPDAGEGARHWDGPRAEMDADVFLRGLPQRGPRGAWAWMVRVHLLLEDRTSLVAHLPLRAGVPAPTVRAAAVAGLRRATDDLQSPPGQRGEARRVLELLTGEPFRYEAAPDFRLMFQEYQRLVEQPLRPAPPPQQARRKARLPAESNEPSTRPMSDETPLPERCPPWNPNSAASVPP
ncbi:MAG: hypothetical protein QOD77_1949 [Thermoplasmata archaeon]|jgi:hypothetical protein|nr:hypothetical protein [Thermoplasmata archaeon]